MLDIFAFALAVMNLNFAFYQIGKVMHVIHRQNKKGITLNAN